MPKVPKIMIVEDNKIVRMTITKILTNNKYEVVAEAINGVEAVNKYKELKPDLVIMDINMPQKSGIEATKDIISIDPKAKIIVCTVEEEQATIIEAVQAGAKGYIVKPFKSQDLLDSVKKTVG